MSSDDDAPKQAAPAAKPAMSRFLKSAADSDSSDESSDEEEDLVNLQTVEQKLLAHDPTFTLEHTHASLTSQRSALMQAFRPQYDEGNVEGARLSS